MTVEPDRNKPGAQAPSFDDTWESLYRRGEQLNRYPESSVVSFVFRNLPKDMPRNAIRVLEVGCGAGNNLWFVAREGLTAAGIDASPTSIDYARRRFAEDQLEGDLRVGDFTKLPFEDDSFHLAINRAALTQTGFSNAALAVAEVWRTLRSGGLFFNEIYSDRTTHGGRPGPDGVTLDVEGRLAGVGQICFYSKDRLKKLFSDGWRTVQLSHLEISSENQGCPGITGQWTIVVEKV